MAEGSKEIPQIHASALTEKKSSSRLSLYALFGGAVAIAFAPIFVRWSVVSPPATAFWRLLLALPVFWIWMGTESRNGKAAARPQSWNDYRILILAGLFFAGDLAVWHWSIKFTSVANSTLLANFAPIFVALGSWLFFKQRISKPFLGGMLVAISGTILLVGGGFGINRTNLFGDLLGVITAVFYGGYILTIKELRGKFGTGTIMFWSGLVTTAALLVVSLLFREKFWPDSLNGWLVVIALALITQVGGQALITFALARLPAAFSSVGLLLQPTMAAIFAWVLLGEAITVWQMVGGAVALSGIYLARRASSS